MRDVTAGRSAGRAINEELDPTRAGRPAAPGDHAPEAEDVTAGSSAGTAWNTAQDPTRPASTGDSRRRRAQPLERETGGRRSERSSDRS